VGQKIDSILCVAILYGGKNFIKRLPLGFDASEKFHRYKIVQEGATVKWLVDGEIIYQLDAQSSRVLQKPMRMYVNFRPAVSHCDEAWGCIRRAGLPTYAYIKRFKYLSNASVQANSELSYPIFDRDSRDNFKRYQDKLWQFSSIDLIKGNKPLYTVNNLKFGKRGLTMIINRERE
jgi:beta-glucanase (GH16 family)